MSKNLSQSKSKTLAFEVRFKKQATSKMSDPVFWDQFGHEFREELFKSRPGNTQYTQYVTEDNKIKKVVVHLQDPIMVYVALEKACRSRCQETLRSGLMWRAQRFKDADNKRVKQIQTILMYPQAFLVFDDDTPQNLQSAGKIRQLQVCAATCPQSSLLIDNVPDLLEQAQSGELGFEVASFTQEIPVSKHHSLLTKRLLPSNFSDDTEIEKYFSMPKAKSTFTMWNLRLDLEVGLPRGPENDLEHIYLEKIWQIIMDRDSVYPWDMEFATQQIEWHSNCDPSCDEAIQHPSSRSKYYIRPPAEHNTLEYRFIRLFDHTVGSDVTICDVKLLEALSFSSELWIRLALVNTELFRLSLEMNEAILRGNESLVYRRIERLRDEISALIDEYEKCDSLELQFLPKLKKKYYDCIYRAEHKFLLLRCFFGGNSKESLVECMKRLIKISKDIYFESQYPEEDVNLVILANLYKYLFSKIKTKETPQLCVLQKIIDKMYEVIQSADGFSDQFYYLQHKKLY